MQFFQTKVWNVENEDEAWARSVNTPRKTGQKECKYKPMGFEKAGVGWRRKEPILLHVSPVFVSVNVSV